MYIHITHPEALAELEYLTARLKLPASEVVERVLVEMGKWTPIETLAYPIGPHQAVD